MRPSPEKFPLAVIGLGNSIAGDDGAGVEAVVRLKKISGNNTGVFLHTLDGDHFEMVDLLDRAEKFIFIDAFEGDRPGELVFSAKSRRAFAPSLHQVDIASVMNCLETLGIIDPFPAWEIWGVTITPPERIEEGLSPEVETAVGIIVERLLALMEETGSGPCTTDMAGGT